MNAISRTIADSRHWPQLLSAALLMLFVAARLPGQESSAGPLTAPPPEHDVKRVVGVPEPEAPPSLPPAQIIKGFSQKEDIYVTARPQYSYRKTIRIQEFGPDGQPSGEYQATYEAGRTSDGKIYEKAISSPQSTLEYLQFEPDDVQQMFRAPAYPLTTAQLPKYVLQYLGTETVDEVECYIFQVHPKTLDRQHPYFDGVIWVDQKYLEVVKTYGKWITDLGEYRPSSLPFSIFETYRENVDGKYWFPNYSRSEEVVKLKNRNVPVRVTIKWSNFKPFPASDTTAAPPSPAPPPPPAANPPAPAKP
jgi:hypothetical protein